MNSFYNSFGFTALTLDRHLLDSACLVQVFTDASRESYIMLPTVLGVFWRSRRQEFVRLYRTETQRIG